ncbi:AMP-dependent synthetase/ligase [Nesterenkonia alba]|uniref:AMP-dependent synthetase/ligase n=1 Tax=Nesterenkonia alba TaxID=515814 RepID=UPI0003B44CDE|nr:AMP-dependent synthetase/ligase [Nesterenkonia alba]
MTSTTESNSENPIRESSTELIVRLPEDVNVTDGVLALHRQRPEHAVYAVRNGAGGWLDVSITAFLDRVRGVAKGLIALGVQPGDRVAVMSQTSYSWAVVDQAVWFAGGISVPIYDTSSVHQIAQLLADSGTKVVLIGSEELRSKVQAGANMGKAEVDIHHIGNWAGLAELAERGSEVTDEQLEQARTSNGLDDVATIVYTSGTTGKPKGVRITHRNLAEGAANLLAFTTEILGEGESRTLLFLPLAHVLARAVQVACLHRGIQVAHTGDTTTLIEDLGSFKPTWLLAVPRVFEKVYHGAAAKAHSEGKGKIFDAARDTAIQYSQALEAAESGRGSGPGLGLKAKHAIFSKLVYGKLHARMGGCVTHFVSGASPLNTDIAHFFTGMGLPVQEGYGLTESTAPITLNIPGATRIGSVGLPVPGNSVKIAEDGEILLKGPVIFDGYHNNDDATEEAFTEDGWFCSGDLGSMDEDGFLTITGRKKELIVTAGGKNVYPTPLEEAVRVHALVGQTVVVGDGKPFVAAMVFPDPENVPAWAQREGYGELSVSEVLQHPEAAEALHSEIQAQIDAANERVSRAESIRKFEIVDAELSEASGHLTPSMKLIRGKVVEDYSDVVERLYAS